MKDEPTCSIIAGPNGAGKTTFALKYLPKIANCDNFINTDEIAKGISPLNFEAGLIPASRMFFKILDQKIADKKDFAFETTLSGRTYLPMIKQWQAAGWKVVLLYLYIPSADFSNSRVKHRVMQGGHNVPEDAIRRRYPRSIHNLFEYADVCDVCYCLNNASPKIQLIFEQRQRIVTKISDQKIYQELKGVEI